MSDETTSPSGTPARQGDGAGHRPGGGEAGVYDDLLKSDGAALLRRWGALPEHVRRPFSRHANVFRWMGERLAVTDGLGLEAERAYQVELGRAPNEGANWSAYAAHLSRSGEARKRAAVRHLSRSARMTTPEAAGEESPQGTAAPLDIDWDVTIIMPVYGGAASLKRCLTSLAAGTSTRTWHALLIDDASPYPDVAEELDAVSRDTRFTIQRLPANAGYIGAVNAGLRRVTSGDVLLLNSDCILPSGDWLDRLAAHEGSGIGTITPLASNGEALGFPTPFKAGPAFVDARLDRIDAAASRANAGRSRDVVTSVGYCTYITRACLDATKELSTQGLRAGYGEEVDFCLRAERHGYRHLAACDVYVTHVGSASFGAAKRRLVKHNEGVLARRYPNYFARFWHQIVGDPLRPARARIEREMLREGGLKGGRLLITDPEDTVDGCGPGWEALQEGVPLRHMTLDIRIGGEVHVRVRSPGLLTVQNQAFVWPGDEADLRDLLSCLAPRDIRIEARVWDRLADPRPHPLRAMLERLAPHACYTRENAARVPRELKETMAGEVYAGLYV